MRNTVTYFLTLSILFTFLLIGNGRAMLIMECADREYLGNQASNIIEGAVKSIENKGGHYYNEILVEKYNKGDAIQGDKIMIVTEGGPGMWVEDEPVFSVGERVKLYLEKTDSGFSIVCGTAGVETLGDEKNQATDGAVIPTQKTLVDPPASTFLTIAGVFAVLLIASAFLIRYKQRNKNIKSK